jgi:mono/diheme cytochrome c family protein
MKLRIGIACLAAAALSLAAGCGQQGAESAPAVVPRPAAAAAGDGTAQAEAKQLFAARCSACHGVSGAGNGPQSDELAASPRDFQDPKWQASVTDSYIEKIIVLGGAGVGKSDAMPAQPSLADKPEVVAALRAYLRGFGAP